MRFPTEPNARNALMERCTISDCGHFRIQEKAGIIYAHTCRTKGEHWELINVFQSRTEAIAACRAAGVPEKKRTRAVRIHADSLLGAAE